MMIRKVLTVTLSLLCFSYAIQAHLDLKALDAYAEVQNYGPVRDIVYAASYLSPAEQMQLQHWLREKSEQGHVPMMYFLVRSFYQANFNGYDPVTIQEALKYRYISLVRIIQDEHCRIAGPQGAVYRYFNKRYEKKFFASVPVTSEMHQTAVREMHEWFSYWDDFEKLPPPYWVAFVEPGAWFQSHSFNYLPVNVELLSNVFQDYKQPINNPRVLGLQNFLKGNFNW